jgi:hypothetical protein
VVDAALLVRGLPPYLQAMNMVRPVMIALVAANLMNVFRTGS